MKGGNPKRGEKGRSGRVRKKAVERGQTLQESTGSAEKSGKWKLLTDPVMVPEKKTWCEAERPQMAFQEN